MSRRTRTLAVALSTAALFGGSTAGVAQAHHGHHGFRHHGHHGMRHHGMHGLADRLGVTQDQLKAAFQTASAQKPDFQANRQQFFADFASGLGVTTDQLKAALQQVREQAHTGDKGDFAEGLASALNIDPAKVQPAWESAKDAFKARAKAQRDAWVAALASALGLPTEQVAAALQTCGGANKFAHRD